ncbi:MAG: treS [Betaproteobacteria bacterium]|nr:treS [Betaproteobacteria bacterium]
MDMEAREADVVTTTAPVPSAHDPLWFKDAVIYQLHVKAFFDSNNDGTGDFRGLTDKLDYIRDLGVDTIWLLPFYPSPMRDDGYDVSDYHNVYPLYGTRHDFRQFVREAHKRGLKIITELIINHTSDQHPWFQAARRAPAGSSKRDFYVWTDDPNKYSGTRIIFTDTETSNWAWDNVAQAHYWHRFFSHQPDLNFDNPLVLKAVFRTMRFWLDLGVDGFRLDAIPYLVERDGTNNENLPETHEVIRQIRAALDRHYEGRALLAEANQWPEDVRQYFGDGDECHMAYHFPLMPRIYMAIALEDRYPVVEIMHQTPEIPDNCQWAIFLRNHDELTLEMVTNKERDYMYQMYAADPRARINLGIRRRLAPLMENDPDRIKLMNSLLLSMPGSPIIYYGDEIGMGDNFYLGDRNGVRTPMQWSPDRNAGFSRADPQRLYLPPIMDAIYGYESVNVEAQTRDPSSLLNWMKRMLLVRRGSRAFGRGRLAFLKPGNKKILAYVRELDGEVILCTANLSRGAQAVELDLSAYKGRVPVELLGRTAFPPIGDLPYMLTIAAHGFYWFRLATDVDVPHWHEDRVAIEDLPMLVLFDGWNSLFRDRVVPWRIGMAEKTRAQYESDVLPRYIELQRWYAGKGVAIKRARIADGVLWQQGRHEWLIQMLELDGPPGNPAYFLPLALAWEEREEDRVRALTAAALVKVRQQANIGIVGDAFADEYFCRALVEAIGAGKEISTPHGRLNFRPAARFAAIAGDDVQSLPVSRQQAQSSNTLVALGERVLLKGYRRLQHGVNPEFEVGRFLTEVAQYPNCVPLAGTLEYTNAEGVVMTLALLQGYVSNQGDAWAYTLDYLGRYLEERRLGTAAELPDVHGAYIALVRILATRTAELHLAFAQSGHEPAFAPEPLTQADIDACRARVETDLRSTLQLLEAGLAQIPEPARQDAQTLLAARQRLLDRIASFAGAGAGGLKTRFHGDFHLGQALLTKNDFMLIDFEGEPGRTFDERRSKQPPMRDVAGMLRSFNYARWSALRAQGIADNDPLAALMQKWENEARQAFVKAYSATAGTRLYESTLAPGSGLLGLFELEKALYELRYELSNRPDWIAIPLHGILELLDAG